MRPRLWRKLPQSRVKVGDPNAEDTTIGPVVSEVQYNKIQDLIQKGIDEGAKLETGAPAVQKGLMRATTSSLQCSLMSRTI